jgi:hypothetical protein
VEPLTDVDQRRIQVIKFRGLARTTRKMYSSGLLLYHVFCNSRGVSEALHAPASTNLIEVFLASIIGAYSASAISNYYAAVQAWHFIHNMSWGFAEGNLSQLIKGTADIAKHIPSLRHIECQPFTIAELNAVCSQLISDNSLDAAVWVCITIAFWGIAYMQELTIPTLSSSSFDSTRHPALLDEIHPDLGVVNDAGFGPEFEHIITRALGSTPRWKEKARESRVSKQYLKFKSDNPDATVNRANRSTWVDHIDITDEDDCESMHSYHDVPPDNHEDERLFKPPDALEEDETTSDIRRVIDWRNAYIPNYMTDFVAESNLTSMVIPPQGRSLVD